MPILPQVTEVLYDSAMSMAGNRLQDSKGTGDAACGAEVMLKPGAGDGDLQQVLLVSLPKNWTSRANGRNHRSFLTPEPAQDANAPAGPSA